MLRNATIRLVSKKSAVFGFYLLNAMSVLLLTTKGTLAQSNVFVDGAFLAIDWLFIACAFVTGIATSVSLVVGTKALTTQGEDDSSESVSKLNSNQNKFRTEIMPLLAVVILIMLLGIGVLVLPSVIGWILAAVGLLLFALLKLDVLRLRSMSTLLSNIPETDFHRTKVKVAVILALSVAMLLLFGGQIDAGRNDNQLQPISALVLALTLGWLLGEFIRRWTSIPRFFASCGLLDKVAGVALIALAIFSLQNVSVSLQFFLLAAFLVVLSVFFTGVVPLGSTATGFHKFRKGTGIVMLIFGVTGLTGAALGGKEFDTALTHLSRYVKSENSGVDSAIARKSDSVFSYVSSSSEYDAMLIEARQLEKPIVVDLYADWCLDCKRMDRTTFKDEFVVKQMSENFVNIKIDITDPKGEFGRMIRKRYGIFGPPAILVFDRQGTITESSPIYGYLSAAELMNALATVL